MSYQMLQYHYILKCHLRKLKSFNAIELVHMNFMNIMISLYIRIHRPQKTIIECTNLTYPMQSAGQDTNSRKSKSWL